MVQSEDGNADIIEKRTELAKIILRENWKLKTKFKFQLLNLPREKQELFIRRDQTLLLESYLAFLAAFKRETYVVPFEKIP